jgi:hypothetical protein
VSVGKLDYDREYLEDNGIVFSEVNGEYYHIDDVVETERGYVPWDDAVTLEREHNGFNYACREDCVKYDGSWYHDDQMSYDPVAGKAFPEWECFLIKGIDGKVVSIHPSTLEEHADKFRLIGTSTFGYFLHIMEDENDIIGDPLRMYRSGTKVMNVRSTDDFDVTDILEGIAEKECSMPLAA